MIQMIEESIKGKMIIRKKPYKNLAMSWTIRNFAASFTPREKDAAKLKE